MRFAAFCSCREWRTRENAAEPPCSVPRCSVLSHTNVRTWLQLPESGEVEKGRGLLMFRGFGTFALIRTSSALSLGLSRNPSVCGAAKGRADSPLLRSRTSTTFRHLTSVLHSMDPKGKGKAAGSSPAPGSVTLETPDWFKPERIRCLTEATTPNQGAGVAGSGISRRGRGEGESGREKRREVSP